MTYSHTLKGRVSHEKNTIYMTIKYQCLICRKIFDSSEEGFNHLRKKGHRWGGLRSIQCQ